MNFYLNYINSTESNIAAYKDIRGEVRQFYFFFLFLFFFVFVFLLLLWLIVFTTKGKIIVLK